MTLAEKRAGPGRASKFQSSGRAGPGREKILAGRAGPGLEIDHPGRAGPGRGQVKYFELCTC